MNKEFLRGAEHVFQKMYGEILRLQDYNEMELKSGHLGKNYYHGMDFALTWLIKEMEIVGHNIWTKEEIKK